MTNNKFVYIEKFVTGHGINFDTNKKNVAAHEESLQKWAEISSSLNLSQNEDSVLMFCGAKNNGKSTLLRYLLNEYNNDIPLNDNGKSLRQSERFAYYVDLDPGQPEMTTPAIVSAHIIRSTDLPLTSPTYLNFFKHEEIVKSCVGGLNMVVNPRIYIENCRFVIRRVKEHMRKEDNKHPIFINTMGFIRGVGLAILFDLIKICTPTHLVVLDMQNDPLRSVCMDLDPKSVQEAPASFYNPEHRRKKLNYVCQRHELQFTFSDSTSVANKNRVALQLAYFGSIPEALYKPILQLTHKIVNLKSTLIHCVSSYPLKANIVLEILYQSWVHLVKLPNEQFQHNRLLNSERPDAIIEPICQMTDNIGENIFMGCGIVVGVDLNSSQILLVTPLDQDILNHQVNCVIKPLSLQVPRQILL